MSREWPTAWSTHPASSVRRGQTIRIGGADALVVRVAWHGHEVMLETWAPESVEHTRTFLELDAPVAVLGASREASSADEFGVWAGNPGTAMRLWTKDDAEQAAPRIEVDIQKPASFCSVDRNGTGRSAVFSPWLMSGTAAQEASELDCAHILVCDFGPALPRVYVGPFPDAAAALSAAAREEARFATELPGNPCLIKVAPLAPDSDG